MAAVSFMSLGELHDCEQDCLRLCVCVVTVTGMKVCDHEGDWSSDSRPPIVNHHQKISSLPKYRVGVAVCTVCVCVCKMFAFVFPTPAHHAPSPV